MRDSFDILLLPGDGIGPEVVGAARRVMDAAARHFGVSLAYEEREIGATAIRNEGEPVSEETLEAARASDSVLLGAVGHPDFDRGTVRPEAGLLRLRKFLGAFANLRPVAAIPSLLSASTLKEEVLKGVDILIVRELTGGAYFGEKEEGEERASDLSVYTREEIERVARVAFDAAKRRKRRWPRIILGYPSTTSSSTRRRCSWFRPRPGSTSSLPRTSSGTSSPMRQRCSQGRWGCFRARLWA